MLKGGGGLDVPGPQTQTWGETETEGPLDQEGKSFNENIKIFF